MAFHGGVSSDASDPPATLIYYTKSGAPTSVSAALHPSSTPTGVNVAFAAPANTGGGNLTYVATAYSGATAIASIASGASSPLYVTGLTTATSYTYRVVASHGGVSSDASDPSAALIYYTQPGKPTGVNPVRSPADAPTGVNVSFTGTSTTGGASLTYTARA